MAGSPSDSGSVEQVEGGNGDERGALAAASTAAVQDRPADQPAVGAEPGDHDLEPGRQASAGEGDDRGGPPARARGVHLAYNPALDGIRGLALMSVLLYHGYGGDLFKGSFLAVSTFFTLSGFLITSLLLGEHRRNGRIALSAFYARRLRRLLPASAATLLVVMLSALFTEEAWERALSGDVIAAGLHVANWRFLFQDRAYADLFQDNQSLVLHFWSLAIEEQFYWIFPLVAAGVLGFFRGSLRAFSGALGLLLLVSLGLTLAYGDQPNTIYYATPIRGGEILMGGLLAALVARGWFLGRDRLVPYLAGMGVVLLVFQVWAWWFFTQEHDSLRWGGLLVYSATSAGLVLSANVDGPVRRLMSFEPLRQLGVVSYGVYLFHWPLFKLLSEERVDGLLDPFNLHLRTWKLLIFRLVVVLVLAAASYHWFELPLRRGQRPRAVDVRGLAVAGVVGVLLVAAVVPRVSAPPLDPLDPGGDQFRVLTEWPDPSELAADSRVAVTVGDSTMLMSALGLARWGHASGHPIVIAGSSAGMGCALGTGGEVRYDGVEQPLATGCQGWQSDMEVAVEETVDHYGRADLALIQAGPWDVADRRLEGESRWRHIGDPEYDAYLRGIMEDATDRLLSEGLTVVWLTSPLIDPTREGNRDRPEFEPERMQRLNELIVEVAGEREGAVTVDLAGWMASQPPDREVDLRPDGIHWTPESATEVAEWLGPEVRAALDREGPPAT